jgi:cytochrome P450
MRTVVRYPMRGFVCGKNSTESPVRADKNLETATRRSAHPLRKLLAMVLVSPPSCAPLLAVAVGVAVAVAAATTVLTRREQAKSLDGKPLRKIHALPNPSFLVGDLFEFLKHAARSHDWFADMSLQFHNEPWRLRIVGQNDLIVLTTPEGLDDVLVKQSEIFLRGEYANTTFEDLLGRSLLTSDGDDWLRQRKAAAKFFTTKALRICMTTTMHKNVQQMYEVLDQHVTSGAALDLSHLLGQFALQTFTEVGLGADLRWIGTELSHPFQQAALHGSPTIVRRFRSPTFWWKLERLLNVGPERKLKEVVTATREWLQMLINASLEALAKRPHRRAGEMKDDTVKSVVELFFEHSQEDAAGLRPEDLVDFIMVFVMAAQDTSALTLTRFFLMLAKHPEVAQRVRQEMAAVLPSLGVTKDTYLTTDHVQHFVYLEATIHEVLRLYPAAPITQRVAIKDTIICGDLFIPEGSGVCLHMYAMARNPNVWGPDAAEFKPERWINETTGELRKFPPTKFAAFGAGPHMCIGMKLAMLELRVVAANLVHRYALSLAVPNDGDYLVGISLLMKNPLLVKVQHAASAATAYAA